jgi:hypothetical protein
MGSVAGVRADTAKNGSAVAGMGVDLAGREMVQLMQLDRSWVRSRIAVLWCLAHCTKFR